MDYLLKAKQILADVLSVSIDDIADDAQIEQLKAAIDSVNFAAIVMEVERFLHKEVPINEWLEIGSVKELAALLERNHQA
jgi:acyl carrier protein